MKIAILLALVACAAAADFSRYNDFNVDEVISNTRLLTAYANCFEETGKCTPEGKDFKKWIPETIQNSCADCSEKQKFLIAKFIVALQKQLPKNWENMKKKHNVGNKYDKPFEEFMKKYSK